MLSHIVKTPPAPRSWAVFLTITFIATSLAAAARFFYGSGVDAQNKPVPRDSKTGQPVPLRFDVPIQ